MRTEYCGGVAAGAFDEIIRVYDRVANDPAAGELPHKLADIEGPPWVAEAVRELHL